MTISELIERLEKATGPDARLDTDIMITLGQWTDRDWWSFDYQKHTPANLTSSLDAAVGLMEKVLPKTAGNLRLATNIRLKANGETHAQIFSHPKQRGHDPSATHRHPAIALCIAILKAKLDSEVAA